MKIACIGNITFDYNVSKNSFIREDRRNNFKEFTLTPGGPASNAAYLLANYGNNVDLYGEIGNVIFGEYVYKQMQKENINLNHVSINDEKTTPFSFIINNEMYNTRTICTVRDPKDYNEAQIKNINYEKKYDYILTDGKYYEESIRLMENNPSATSIIDAGRVTRETLMLCNFADIIICSEDFANEVVERNISNNEEENREIYKDLKSYFPFAEKIVITIGAKGYICEKDGEVVTMSAYKSGIKAIDTTGAGDIFHGAFTHAMANNYSFQESLEFANITASLSTTKRGGRYSITELSRVEELMKEKTKILRKE